MIKTLRRILSAVTVGVIVASFGAAGANTAMAADTSNQSISDSQTEEEVDESLQVDMGNTDDGSDDVLDVEENSDENSISVPENILDGTDRSVDEEMDEENYDDESISNKSEEIPVEGEEYEDEIIDQLQNEVMLASTEPNYTQGGAGTRTDVSDQVKLWTTQRVRYNYDDNGRNYGSFFTIMSNMVSEDGTVVGWSICVDPKRNGLYAGLGGSFSKIYRFDAPMMKKAIYYADGTGHNYAREIYAQSHGGSTDEGGVLILMHAALSEIYARLGWAYKSDVGDYQSGASDLLTEDGKRYISLLNTLPEVSDEYYVDVGTNRDNDYQDFGFLSKRLEKGSLTLVKNGDHNQITAENALYSLEGATYTVYSDSKLTNQVGTLTTKSDGTTAAIENLTPGTYYVKESKAPLGYSLDESIHMVEVQAGHQATVNVSDKPLYDTAIISIEKKSTQETSEDGLSTAGTLFEIRYYPEYYNSIDAIGEEKPYRTWIIEAKDNEEGVFASLDENHLTEGSDELFLVDGNPVLPLGTIVMRELKSAEGYIASGTFMNRSMSGESLGEVFIGEITGEDKVSLYYGQQKVEEGSFFMENTPIYGGVKIAKLDYESKSSVAQAEASLSGATFDIVNDNEYTVSVNGSNYKKGETVLVLTTDENGVAQTESNCLPYGRYTVVETEPPTGYSCDGITERKFTIEENGVTVDLTDPSNAILNRVIRGDIVFRKIEANSQRSIAGVDFTITLISTGEKHTITVDENGVFDSRESDLWFGEGEKQEGIGALPFGEYLLEEIQTEVNSDYQMYRGSFVVSEDGQIIDLHNIENRDKPDLGTELTSEKSSHEAAAAKNVVLTDTVSYYNFEQYVGRMVTIKGTLMDKSTGKPIVVDGKEVTAEKTVVIKNTNGQVKLTFVFDASEFDKREVVAFEHAYDEEGALIAAHAELKDAAQTVKFEKGEEEKPKKSDTTPAKGAKTGDETNVLLWITLLVGTVILLGATVIMMRKKHDISNNHKM